MKTDYSEYSYRDNKLNFSHEYLLPTVQAVLKKSKPKQVIDLGCGNGSVANVLQTQGYEVIGIDASESGIAQARSSYPNVRFEHQSVYADIRTLHGTFPAVVSLEVIEHLYSPLAFMNTVANILEPGGIAIISTPYHGYLKNLALAVSGKLDAHFTALWEGGHIKFWSISTLSTLIENAGLQVDGIYRVGRVPPLAKSMILVAKKPTHSPQNTGAKGTPA